MTALIWDVVGQRFYETGVDRAVFYPRTGNGVVWNGLTAVNQLVTGGDKKDIYLDGEKQYVLVESEDFQAEIEAFSAPAEFLACDGVKTLAAGLYVTQQPRSMFGFSYRTIKGNDVKNNDYSYYLHLVYNALASPTTRRYSSVSDSITPTPLSWTIDTVPPDSTTYKSSAHLQVDVSLITTAKKTALENLLYGTSSTNPGLPTQSAVITLLGP